MAFVVSTDLGNASLSSIDEILVYATNAAGWNDAELSATRSLMIRDLDLHATNTTTASPTPSMAASGIWGNSSNTIALAIGSILAGSFALIIAGCLVFAGMKLHRGEPVFSFAGLNKMKIGDVEKADGNGKIPAGPGAGRFY